MNTPTVTPSNPSDASAETSARGPAIYWRSAIPAVLAPVIVWTTVIVFATIGGFPGVACITPMAVVILPLWAGLYYARRRGPATNVVPGALVAGALIGLAMAGLFIYGSSHMMASETRPSEIALSQNLNRMMAVGSIIIATLVSAFAARFLNRRWK